MDQEKTTPLKLYYNIREVADSLGLNPSLLRYWETEFPMLQPKKNRKGNRMYTEKDLELLRQIHYLLKERRFTIKGALAHLNEKGSKIPETLSIKERLLSLRAGLVELKKTLDQETP
ncbi:MAG: MerR family transcriptional regulator [Bacteroidota bacterium]|jgi:DNA-binding transcriptional MerR regulator|nr:MerR family transcriptional regulator [Bacteroidia bacterium]